MIKSIVVSILSLSMICCSVSVFAEEATAPQVSMFTKMVVTPFTSGAANPAQSSTTYYEEFEVLERDFSAQSSYEKFCETLSAVLDETDLCAGTGELHERMRDCANDTPDEFATVANILEQYLEWQAVELSTILDLYKTKITSPLLHERLEARLVMNCVKHEMSDGDTRTALDTCQSPVGWDLDTIFRMPCSGAGAIDTADWNTMLEHISAISEFKDDLQATISQDHVVTNSFSYRYYAAKCIVSKQVRESLGAYQLVTLLPEFSVELLPEGAVRVRVEPPAVKPAEMYVLISSRLKKIILSDWFARDFQTEACIPSLFTPDNIAEMTLEKRRLYYSFCIPTRYVSMLRKLPAEDYLFFAEALANRIAIIETLELLNSAALVADEVYRTISQVDRELGQLVKAHAQYSKSFAKIYHDSLDLAKTRTVEDILHSIEHQFSVYLESEAQKDAHEKHLASDLVRMRNAQQSGVQY